MRYKTIEIKKDQKDFLDLYICGDTVQTESNKSLFETGKVSELIGDDLFKRFQNADVAIFNLESPLTDCSTPIFKPGAPCLRSSAKSINFFSNIPSKVKIISAANNHIKDYGNAGISQTIDLLSSSSVDYIGISSKDLEDAKTSIVIRKGEISVGLYSLCENEFSTANNCEGGANGFDPLFSFDDIASLSKITSKVIVIFHAGREHYRFPPPQLQRVCRKMVDCGASIVICNHSHVIGCYEKYKESTIVYGTGNFIFDRLKRAEWNNGLVINLSIKTNGFTKSFIPTERSNEKIREMHEESASKIIEEFNERSKLILSNNAILTQWNEFCKKDLEQYIIHGLFGIKNRYILAFDRHFNHIISKKLLSNKHHRSLLLNFLRCESIRESIMAILSESFWDSEKK